MAHTVLPGLINVHTHAIDWAKGILRGEIATHAIGDRAIVQVLDSYEETIRGLA